MRRHIYKCILLTAALFVANACSKEELDLQNPNSPGRPALQSEEGLKRAGMGVYNKFSSLYYLWYALTDHEIMGDSYFSSVGNFAWRWVNQPTKIILSNGTTLTPPQGGSQISELKARNNRSFGDENVFYHEWELYFMNNQANLILDVLKSSNVTFSGNGETKKKALQAWAYWWKGFVYSRIGSIYIAGVITDTPDKTNADFVEYPAIIAEANKNFDAAAEILSTISETDVDYTEIISAVTPSFLKKGKGGVIKPAEWIRNINTYKARNILVNKSLTEMTPADWNAIITLANNGIRANDIIFTMRTAAENAVIAGGNNAAWMPGRSLIGWCYISERLIQDFKPGDARFTRNFKARTSPIVNNSGRGFQYGTRWDMIPIESGGNYSSTVSELAEIPLACSYEENQLMLAEANIKLNQIDVGLGFIDQVRTYQNASLAAVAGTGLNETQAYEELRRERRIGLLNKNVSFYDARRWGILKPLEQGGGRTGAVVLYSGGVVDTNATIDYNYLSRWDVPLHELDFNTPSNPSVPVIGF
ncbi:hypothetical protein KK083_18790 [Fulvivirgaceae bacterium PWU4]|uniref:RagB/SusD family nutrient uptake outer membrane protein n=1 Tax=Chryseosolibacter histidini TaxID=2782349 RepID=A0AAP2GPC2_9BACT|nr:RagB/SusD family nutrient uptake outer membrane protein [Chryseosolibacter histidini]MBT1698948.1 hypothetical protein [Chryseosolibacter histidini]